MKNNRCKSCGGDLIRKGDYYLCAYCGTQWEINNISNDAHAVELVNAWSTLREGDFEKATELFENIIVRKPKHHEAYWGRALALNGIVYVTDLSENKKVATCNNITEDSFIKCKDLQQAIVLAPAEIAEAYRKQADYIENVRKEWLEKARKEAPYDIFISFKDKDDDRNRTQDSNDAYALYNVLTQQGYKVFFSRVSLSDKVSEHYEPYIYNAIKTAKVMIVFGEKPEYFSSAWIKNEWSRFAKRIKNGEKHKNSLVVVYKNMEPGDLPAALKSRQCLDANDITFLSTLERHIKRVINESASSEHLEKINISGGQIAKKATTLSVNTVRTREIGEGAIAETSISEKQTVDLIYTYLSESQWDSASNLIEDVLFSNPGCAEALWCRLLANHKAKDDAAITSKLDRFGKADYEMIEKILNCASKAFAEKILMLLYQSEKNVNDDTYHHILTAILPFSFDNRKVCIDQAFEDVIERRKYQSFRLLLTTLSSNEVDRYISYNLTYERKTSDHAEKTECLEAVLLVDPSNAEALRGMVHLTLSDEKNTEQAIHYFEDLLKYSREQQKETLSMIDNISKNISTSTDSEFFKQLLRYYSGNIADLKTYLIASSFRMLENGLFNKVEYFLKLILSFEPNNPEAYWGICLMKLEAKTEKDIINGKLFLKDVPEFNKYLTFCTEQRRRECIQIVKAQEQKLLDFDKKINDLRQQRLLKKETIKTYKAENRTANIAKVLSKISMALLVLGIILAVVIPMKFDVNTVSEELEYFVFFSIPFGLIFTVLLKLVVATNDFRSLDIKFLKEEIKKIDKEISQLMKSRDSYQSK